MTRVSAQAQIPTEERAWACGWGHPPAFISVFSTYLHWNAFDFAMYFSSFVHCNAGDPVNG